MKKLNINPNEIGIWHPGGIKAHDEPLENIIRREGWKNIPRVPVYKLPKDRKNKHKYVLVDGHGRYNAAVITCTSLPCILYAPNEKLDVVKDKLASFSYSDKVSYERILALYLHYMQNYA